VPSGRDSRETWLINVLDTFNESKDLIDTRVNFWPSLVDAVSCVLILMFLLYAVKGVAGEMEAIRAHKAMLAMQALIEQKFQQAGLGNVVHCQPKNGILEISFGSEVLFDPARYELHPRGKQAMRVCAEALTASSAPHFEQIQVEGYTDSQPLNDKVYPHDNWELSSARAVAVLKELVALGVKSKVISANAYADQQKVDEAQSEDANKKNRRIELRIFYSIPKTSEQRRP
jgi:flagellar motor protein MotB